MRISPQSIAAATASQPVISIKMVHVGLISASFAHNGHKQHWNLCFVVAQCRTSEPHGIGAPSNQAKEAWLEGIHKYTQVLIMLYYK